MTSADSASELVQAALKIDPTHWKALAMAGTAAFDRKDYKGAVDYWERLRSSSPTPIVQSIAVASVRHASSAAFRPQRPSLRRPEGLTGGNAVAKCDCPCCGSKQERWPRTGTTVGGVVNLSDAIKAKASPTDTVFIFARPAEGSRMPLALTQVKVSELPARFTLDDTMAMSKDMKLSNSALVELSVHQVRTADALQWRPRGALQARRGRFKDVAVTIDRVLP